MEALMLNHKGEVAECTADNIFLVRDKILYTPPKDAGILAGVTRATIIELAAKRITPCVKSRSHVTMCTSRTSSF